MHRFSRVKAHTILSANLKIILMTYMSSNLSMLQKISGFIQASLSKIQELFFFSFFLSKIQGHFKDFQKTFLQFSRTASQ